MPFLIKQLPLLSRELGLKGQYRRGQEGMES